MGNLKDGLLAVWEPESGENEMSETFNPQVVLFESLIELEALREMELVTDSDYLPISANDNLDCGETDFELPPQWDAKERERMHNEGNGIPYDPWD